MLVSVCSVSKLGNKVCSSCRLLFGKSSYCRCAVCISLLGLLLSHLLPRLSLSKRHCLKIIKKYRSTHFSLQLSSQEQDFFFSLSFILIPKNLTHLSPSSNAIHPQIHFPTPPKNFNFSFFLVDFSLLPPSAPPHNLTSHFASGSYRKSNPPHCSAFLASLFSSSLPCFLYLSLLRGRTGGPFNSLSTPSNSSHTERRNIRSSSYTVQSQLRLCILFEHFAICYFRICVLSLSARASLQICTRAIVFGVLLQIKPSPLLSISWSCSLFSSLAFTIPVPYPASVLIFSTLRLYPSTDFTQNEVQIAYPVFAISLCIVFDCSPSL